MDDAICILPDDILQEMTQEELDKIEELLDNLDEEFFID